MGGWVSEWEGGDRRGVEGEGAGGGGDMDGWASEWEEGSGGRGGEGWGE